MAQLWLLAPRSWLLLNMKTTEATYTYTTKAVKTPFPLGPEDSQHFRWRRLPWLGSGSYHEECVPPAHRGTCGMNRKQCQLQPRRLRCCSSFCMTIAFLRPPAEKPVVKSEKQLAAVGGLVRPSLGSDGEVTFPH